MKEVARYIMISSRKFSNMIHHKIHLLYCGTVICLVIYVLTAHLMAVHLNQNMTDFQTARYLRDRRLEIRLLHKKQKLYKEVTKKRRKGTCDKCGVIAGR